jgi:hypothetical protein
MGAIIPLVNFPIFTYFQITIKNYIVMEYSKGNGIMSDTTTTTQHPHTRQFKVG